MDHIKVNPWLPYEVHASPHDLPGYDEELFPVADTAIGRIGCTVAIRGRSTFVRTEHQAGRGLEAIVADRAVAAPKGVVKKSTV
jgi:hypothetical protein